MGSHLRHQSRNRLVISVVLSIALGALVPAAADATERPVPTLVFADEFSGTAGVRPSAERWRHEVGGHGWGNDELQTFTDRAANSALNGEGVLDLTARREAFTGSDGYARDYTSARLITKGRFSFRYGKVEARIKPPAGAGLWPLFWMMGDDAWDAGWPVCGEIDIMEMRGREPATVQGTVHGPFGVEGAQWQNGKAYTASAPLTDDYHVFAVKWWDGGIEWLVDGVPYHRVLRSQTPLGGQWVFDKPFHLILSLPVGGSWPGPPNARTRFPATMSVDWVRVYQYRSPSGAETVPVPPPMPTPAVTPAVPPPPTTAGQPDTVPASAAARAAALRAPMLSVRRAQLRDGRVSIRADVARRATGVIRGLIAYDDVIRTFTARVDAAGRIAADVALPRSAPKSVWVAIAYSGNARFRKQWMYFQAAPLRARLSLDPIAETSRTRRSFTVTGRVNPLARGRIVLALSHRTTAGELRMRMRRTAIVAGRFKRRVRFPARARLPEMNVIFLGDPQRGVGGGAATVALPPFRED